MCPYSDAYYSMVENLKSPAESLLPKKGAKSCRWFGRVERVTLTFALAFGRKPWLY
jgi:hypothetical protein